MDNVKFKREKSAKLFSVIHEMDGASNFIKWC